MPATPKSNIIRLRLTDLEKQDWQRAAGSARGLSEWIRQQCNAAAHLAAMGVEAEEAVAHVAERKLEETKTPLSVPVLPKPVIIEDAIQRSVEEQAHRESRPLPATEARGDDSSPGDRTAAGAKPSGAAPTTSCERAWAHRPGVYCGTCKRVVSKR